MNNHRHLYGRPLDATWALEMIHSQSPLLHLRPLDFPGIEPKPERHYIGFNVWKQHLTMLLTIFISFELSVLLDFTLTTALVLLLLTLISSQACKSFKSHESIVSLYITNNQLWPIWAMSGWMNYHDIHLVGQCNGSDWEMILTQTLFHLHPLDSPGTEQKSETHYNTSTASNNIYFI